MLEAVVDDDTTPARHMVGAVPPSLAEALGKEARPAKPPLLGEVEAAQLGVHHSLRGTRRRHDQ